MKRHTDWEKYRQRTRSKRATHSLQVFNETKVRIPRTIMKVIYNDLLKKKCSLTVIGVGDTFSKKLNNTYRKKNVPANILTFPPDNNKSAEIYINTALAEKTAKKHTISTKKQIIFLYIHGILHLLGHAHGEKMEILEDRYVTKYI